jgi:hypothetical protein
MAQPKKITFREMRDMGVRGILITVHSTGKVPGKHECTVIPDR